MFSLFKLQLYQLQSLCENLRLHLLSWLFSVRDTFYSKVPPQVTDLVRQVLSRGHAAVKAHLANTRHLVGDIFLILGWVSIFLHQFFPEPPNDPTWYYTNWFYFIYTLRPYLILMFASLAVLYYWPPNSKSVYIIFTFLHSAGWLGVIHYSFFVYDYKTFHTFPVWYMCVLALSFGIGFVFAIDHLVYIWEHKRKGNHCRFVGTAEMDLDPIHKESIFKSLAKEFRELNTKY